MLDTHETPCFQRIYNENVYPAVELDIFYNCLRINRQTLENSNDGETWQIVYTCIILLLMFIALISDRVGADMVMCSALALLMAPSKILTVSEGIEGFANEGLLTVLVLFVVAAGISHTGALDWYMGKLLGRPASTSSAQLRLMLPIGIVSAFLNNTPVVAVMIPIVQKWGKNVGVSPQQLLMPLSFASILGGTCTLIGTSTNLVVVGLLQARYPDDDDIGTVGLFDLGLYGVPVAFTGIAYILIMSQFLLPGGSKFIGGSGNDGSGYAEVPMDFDDSILLGARLTKWSGAAGRSVKRSGLRDSGGLYLVSVHRAATGNVHRAVGQDFVLNVDDVLYFTGLVEGFGDFCQEHGLEVITNEVEDSVVSDHLKCEENKNDGEKISDANTPVFLVAGTANRSLPVIHEISAEVGTTKESLLQSDEAERWRNINRIQDTIRGITPADDVNISQTNRIKNRSSRFKKCDPAKIIVVSDANKARPLVVVAVTTCDRHELLSDISKCLIRLNLNFHQTEAIVIDERSFSLWRCEVLQGGVSDIEEIWSVLFALLENDSGSEAMKHRGQRVVRAVVTKQSSLVGFTAAEVDFREKYKAAIIAVQRSGHNLTGKLSQMTSTAGDILILQANDNSPLLMRPPEDFYKKKRSSSSSSFTNLVKKKLGSFGSQSSLQSITNDTENKLPSTDIEDQKIVVALNDDKDSDWFIGSNDESHASSLDTQCNQKNTANHVESIDNEQIWKDLAVIFPPKMMEDEDSQIDSQTREFLTAMEVKRRSKLVKKSVVELGLSTLPGVFLVCIERPSKKMESNKRRRLKVTSQSEFTAADSEDNVVAEPSIVPISNDDPLEEGDVLWFSGSAIAIGDLRKIPGLTSYVDEEVKKIKEKVHDRRLVQAVISRKGPLVGKTAREIQFRTRYGAAVIAVHREGRRVQEYPGKVKLQAGDVLLLEAGPTFIKQNSDSDTSFALLSEVAQSAPPRMSLLIPALGLAIIMLVIYTAGVAPLLVCGLIASILMVCFGILSQQEARDAINWEVYVTIACAFGIGTALTNSGVAGGVANGLVKFGRAINIGDAGLFGAVYFATFFISNVVTNNAAAALIFPIAMDAAEMTGADRKLMSYILMLGASASFMSPFGYTTNLLIYGPGGYKYVDFLRIGIPMQIILWIFSVCIISVADSWYIFWIATFIFLILVSAAMIYGEKIRLSCNKNE